MRMRDVLGERRAEIKINGKMREDLMQREDDEEIT